MKIAIIDMGTNTFNLLIKDSQSGDLIHSDKLPVTLGEGGINENTITPEAFNRGMEALDKYRQVIRGHGLNQAYVFATSAVRGAANQDAFIRSAFDQFGIKINLLNGLQEAKLIYKGVRQAVKMENEPHLIVDIGGGSTEFIFGNGEEILWMQSYDIGSSRLMQIFLPADPITKGDIERIENYLAEALMELKEQQEKYQARALVGSSGSFDTFADIIRAKDPDEKTGYQRPCYEFDMESYYHIAERIIRSDRSERLNMRGMLAMRSDMIIVVVIFVNFILRYLQIDRMKLSSYSLKEGVFHSIKEKEQQWQKSLL